MSGLTPVAERLSITLDGEYLRMLNEWFFKWHFIGKNGPVQIDSFDGRTLNYGGISFFGTTQKVYWDTIQRYLRKKIGTVFDDIESQLPKYPIEVRERTLYEVFSIVAQFAGRIRRAAVEKDRILRGNGFEFPPECDMGKWAGCGRSDIEMRVSSLLDIYCDRRITIEGVEMSLKSMMKDKLTFVKKDGTVNRENVLGLVTTNQVTTFAHDLPIELGDHFLRKLPSGLVDDFVVTDPGYTSGIGSIDAHFQAKVRRSDIPAALPNTVIQSITNNLSGANSRLNIDSIDNSVNLISGITIEQLSAFLAQVRPATVSLPAKQREEIETHLAILEGEIKSPTQSQSRITSALRSIKTIGEGVAGNLVAAGIVALIEQMLLG